MAAPDQKSLASIMADIHGFLRYNKDGQALWDILTALRGPDSPSETPDMNPVEAAKAYRGRRDRKFKTVEVIRAATFPGVGSARSHSDTKVTLPPSSQWDHFDKHVARAAGWLKLKVEER